MLDHEAGSSEGRQESFREFAARLRDLIQSFPQIDAAFDVWVERKSGAEAVLVDRILHAPRCDEQQDCGGCPKGERCVFNGSMMRCQCRKEAAS